MTWAIVAIPKPDDYVWNISSQKIPHLTLMVLSESGNAERIFSYLEHAVETSLPRFGMDVSRRGTLGEKDADVLFFGQHCRKKLVDFRSFLLANDDIYKSYHEVPQFPLWIPHLTLGFPDDPAKPDTRDYPGTSWINFDRLALWTGDFEGPEILLPNEDALGEDTMSMTVSDEDALLHFGVKGMKWGVRKDKGHEGQRAKLKKIAKLDRKFARDVDSLDLTLRVYNGGARIANSKLHEINNKPKYKNVQDFTVDTPLTRQYYREHHQLLLRSIEQSARDIGTNASGTKRYQVIDKGDSWDIVLADVQHAADSAVVASYKVEKDDKGRVLGLELIEAVEQSSMFDIDDFLEHFGVKGMKWGVRRASSKSSSRRTQGRTKASPDHNKAQSLSRNNRKTLTNEELALIIKRRNLEQQLSNLNPSKLKRGQDVVKAIVATVGTVSSVITLAKSPAGTAAITAVKAVLRNVR